MALVTYIDHEGNAHEADIPIGNSVMQGAVDNMIDGIIAECGGACSCATCHVYIDEAWEGKVGDPDEMEKCMIDCVMDPKPNSRLSCQVKVTEELDGLVVHLPETQ